MSNSRVLAQAGDALTRLHNRLQSSTSTLWASVKRAADLTAARCGGRSSDARIHGMPACGHPSCDLRASPTSRIRFRKPNPVSGVPYPKRPPADVPGMGRPKPDKLWVRVSGKLVGWGRPNPDAIPVAFQQLWLRLRRIEKCSHPWAWIWDAPTGTGSRPTGRGGRLEQVCRTAG